MTSAGNNNGSAFAGLSANTPFYNTLLAVAMWLGRFGVIVPVLAIAGALAAKKRLPVTAAPCPRTVRCSSTLLIGTVLLVGLLNYVPALALGPGGRAPDALAGSRTEKHHEQTSQNHLLSSSTPRWSSRPSARPSPS